jgi:hypothetical protein
VTEQVLEKSIPEHSWSDLYRAAGIAALLTGVLYLAATLLIFVTPMQPTSGGTATLEYISANRTSYIFEQLLYNAPGVLGLVVFLGLYIALRQLNKSYAAIGALLGVASMVESLVVFDRVAGLVALSDGYTAAATDAQRLVFSTAAEALVVETNIAYAAGVVTAIGILILSLVMLKGVFTRGVAYLGIVTGALGIISEGLRTVIGPAYIVYGILLIVWFIVIGRALYLVGPKVKEQPSG